MLSASLVWFTLAHAAPDDPWQLGAAVDAPEWLDVGLTHRSRVEVLLDDYRAATDADATILSMRTLATVSATFDPVSFGLEVQDARAYGTPSTPLNPTTVNPLEVLEATVELRADDLIAEGDTVDLRLGRMTMDVGSRRLVARNQYRNTSNGFTGLDVSWTSARERSIRAFLVVPVTRLPTDADAIARNRVVFDREDLDAPLWGMFSSLPDVVGDADLELYVLGLHERAARQLVTPGLRTRVAPDAGRLDAEVEAVVQVGRSEDLPHRALFTHGAVGYTVDAAWATRVALAVDYASGDGDPNDGVSGRFDTLFGAQRFEYGPTGTYGPIARSNLASVGARVEVEPNDRLHAFGAYRLHWLASARDAWPPAGLRDPTGESGNFIGHLPEVSVRWQVLPQNLELDVGAAWLLRGGFAAAAPGGRAGTSTLLYTQLTAAI